MQVDPEHRDPEWERHWPGTSPHAERLREAWPERWVRLHLERPGRPDVLVADRLGLGGDVLVTTYPLDGPDAPTIEDLSAALGLSDLVVLHQAPTAVVWRARSRMPVTALLDRARADAEAGVAYRLALTSADLGRLLFPYGPGVDVFAEPEAVGALRSELSAWLSERADGL